MFVCVSGQKHIWWRHGGHVCKFPNGTLIAKVQIRFSWSWNRKNNWVLCSFYIQSFSLTECIVVVRVRKTGVVCVCVCVCVSVKSRLAKLLGRFQPNLPKLVPQWSSCVRFIFSSLTYLMTSWRPFCMRARGHCHGHSFYPIFFKFGL